MLIIEIKLSIFSLFPALGLAKCQKIRQLKKYSRDGGHSSTLLFLSIFDVSKTDTVEFRHSKRWFIVFIFDFISQFTFFQMSTENNDVAVEKFNKILWLTIIIFIHFYPRIQCRKATPRSVKKWLSNFLNHVWDSFFDYRNKWKFLFIDDTWPALPCLSDEVRALPLYLAVENKLQYLMGTVGEAILLYVTCLALFFQIYRALKKYGKVRSKQTLELQKKLMKAMFLQLAIPFSIISIPMAYFSYTPFFNAALNNTMYIIVATHGFISTIVMLIVQKPYREFILGGFGKFFKLRQSSENVSGISLHSMNTIVAPNRMFWINTTLNIVFALIQSTVF